MGTSGMGGIGGGKQVGREGGGDQAKSEPSRQGLALTNEMWGGSFSGREDHIEVGYTGFEVVG